MAAKARKSKAAKIQRRKTTPAPLEIEPVAAQPAPDKTAESDITLNRRESERYDGDTAIKLYLREIGQVKLLTPQGKSNSPRKSRRAIKRRANR